jgi:signal transduction histidine kinase
MADAAGSGAGVISAGAAVPEKGAAAKDAAGTVRIVLSLSDSLPPASADAQQVRMAFTNIIKNAIEAQPGGGVLEIKSALSRRSAGTRAWRDRAGGAVGGAGAYLSGAGRAAGESPLEVVLTSVPPERAGEDFVEITFQDSGSGISESEMCRVGTPHFTTKKRGTGLGLAMVSKIVSQHGGALSIESREARGTTVRILLPVQGTVN